MHSAIFKLHRYVLILLTFNSLAFCSDPQPFGEKELAQGVNQTAETGANSGKRTSENTSSGSLEDPFSRSNDGNAKTIEDLENGARLEQFLFGGESVSGLVDYLFVLDNSCSMNGIGAKVASGFLSLVGSEILPEKAQIAVMSTMHADEKDYSKTGIGVLTYPGIEFEPGFLSFVNKKAISTYRNLASPAQQKQWSLEGCESSWFPPDAKGAGGFWCIEAATQSTNSCVGAEAGIRAYGQLIAKYANARLFRRSAILNVIFVSDTHDPGTNVDALAQGIKAYDELKAMTLNHNSLAGIKFHALAPSGSRCTFEGLYEESYNRLANDSGGLSQDPCDFETYDSFMADMVTAGSKPDNPIFSVTKPIKQIIEITVNGSRIENYEIIDTYTIKIPQLLNASEPSTIDIVYSYQ